MSEAPRITEANWHGQSGRNGRHERKMVWQFKQICNRQGERNIAVNRDVLPLAATHLFTPLARQRVLIKDHRQTYFKHQK
jgi:hypothetical protein